MRRICNSSLDPLSCLFLSVSASNLSTLKLRGSPENYIVIILILDCFVGVPPRKDRPVFMGVSEELRGFWEFRNLEIWESRNLGNGK